MPEQSSTSARWSHRRSGVRFVITAGLLSVAFFGLLRLPQVESRLLLPFTRAQHGLACRIGGDPDAPISVGLSCSAADVIALCLGFVLAFPVSWRRRLGGALVGLALIAAINIVRIASLSRAVDSRRWFELLHVYVWPGVLLVAVSLYVFWWMSRSMRSEAEKLPAARATSRRLPLPRRGLRFAALTVAFTALFIGTSRWWMQSEFVLGAAHWVAATGAFVIRLFGGEATVVGNSLRTANGGWRVTQECIMTPLMPAYLAAVLALQLGRFHKTLALAAAAPLFFLLGTARLLVLALPARLVGSHLTAIHAFYQVLVAMLLVALAAVWSEPGPRSAGRLARRIAVGTGCGVAAAIAVGLSYTPLLLVTVERLHGLLGHSSHAYLDPQGALRLMAPYQLGLLIALAVACRPRASWRRTGLAAGGLLALQPLTLLLIGEWVAHIGIEPHVAALRAAILAMTLLVAAPALIHGSARPATRRAGPAIEARRA